jgi:streptomycin 6-kinase
MNKFKHNIIAVYSENGRRWLGDLAKSVKDIAKLWSLSELTAVNNLTYHYILSGYQNNKPIILKLGVDHQALAREALVLNCLADFGAVKVFDTLPGALLLERAVPGQSLKQVNIENKTAVCCDVMKRLHQTPVPKNEFPHISEWLATLDCGWDIPKQLLNKACQLKSQLNLNGPEVLLHGDLHHDNILSSGNGWKVIDPKGVIGHPLHEIWAFVMDIEKDIPYIAKALGYSEQQVLQCYYIHLVLAACWNVEDKLDPKLFLDLAEKVYPLLTCTR